MSGALRKLSHGGSFRMRSLLNKTGQAGPLRLVVIAAGLVTVVATIIAVSFSGKEQPPQSQTTAMPAMNPLPGGPNTNANQDRLALQHNQQQAEAAARQEQSFTPSFPASRPGTVPAGLAAPDLSPVVTPSAPAATALPAAAAPARPLAAPAAPAARPTPGAVRPMQQAAQTNGAESREDQLFRAAVADILNGWGGRPSRTDLVIPPTRTQQGGSGGTDEEASGEGEGRYGSAGADRGGALQPASTMARTLPQQVLMPAGRGVYAHTVLAVNSDTGGPIVLQADTGPIAGDRVIGTFSRAGSSDLLVVKVTSIVHNGQAMPVDGVVIAPDSMETAVASSVDQHYLSRFLLPAAAAFIQGLGQAIATTSNSQTVLSPFGGAAYSTNLNLDQQLGVGAGVAGARIGAALNQSAPRNSTINLAANASVGIMFLTSVTVPQR